MKINGLSIFSVLSYSAFMAISVIFLISAAYGYERFINSYQEAATAQSSAEPGKCRPQKLDDIQLRKVKFSFNNKHAEEVYLYADFNLWGSHKIKLEKENGTFSKMIVLPQGEYKYYYNVDGAELSDPGCPQSIFFNGREVSIKTVL